MTITTTAKKEFIRWFLQQYQLKRRECVWILNYLIGHDDILKNIKFVENAHFCPRGIVMTTHCVDDKPFRFYKNGNMTTDAEKCFHDIRLNRDEIIYVELNFKDRNQSVNYLGVLEEHDFTPSEQTKQYSKIAQNFLDHSLYLFKKNQLSKLIDEAIDNGDSNMFFKLSEEMNSMINVGKAFELIKR